VVRNVFDVLVIGLWITETCEGFPWQRMKTSRLDNTVTKLLKREDLKASMVVAYQGLCVGLISDVIGNSA